MVKIFGLVAILFILDSCQTAKPQVDSEPTMVSVKKGRTYQGRPLSLNKLETGKEEDQAILLVGGIHGGFESPSVYFVKWYKEEVQKRNPKFDFYTIDALNPDSLFREGDSDQELIDKRFSAHGVDLNRNFPANWQRDVDYRDGVVRKFGGGFEPFSEPETRFLRQCISDLQSKYKKLLVVMVHTLVYQDQQGGIVMPSYKSDTPNPQALAYAEAFKSGSGFDYISKWQDYPVSGEFLAWAGETDLPALDIELAKSPLHFEAIPETFKKAKIGLDTIIY